VVTFNDASDPAMQETDDFNVVVLRKTNIIDGRLDEKQLLLPIWLLLRNKVRDPTVPLADASYR
jgi:hypothetical protein